MPCKVVSDITDIMQKSLSGRLQVGPEQVNHVSSAFMPSSEWHVMPDQFAVQGLTQSQGALSQGSPASPQFLLR